MNENILRTRVILKYFLPFYFIPKSYEIFNWIPAKFISDKMEKSMPSIHKQLNLFSKKMHLFIRVLEEQQRVPQSFFA